MNCASLILNYELLLNICIKNLHFTGSWSFVSIALAFFFLIVSVIMICQTKKFLELDQQNKNQEDKFLNYIQGMSFFIFRICFLLFLSLVAMNA